jgi:hypothetical protein
MLVAAILAGRGRRIEFLAHSFWLRLDGAMVNEYLKGVAAVELPVTDNPPPLLG